MRPVATLKALAHPILHIPPLVKQITPPPPPPTPTNIIMKHFTACNIQFPECRRLTLFSACNIQFPEYRRLTLFSCVMTILTSWKRLCGYDRDDMSCQEFCTVCLLRTFPSHYSICKHSLAARDSWCPAPTCCIFLFSYFFVMISPIENAVVRVLLYHVDHKPLQFHLIVHYLYMSCGVSTETIYGFWRLWPMGFKFLEKHNFISLSNAPIFIYKRCRTRESI